MAKTALIVDDVVFVRKALADILMKANFQIVGEAADGQEAIELYVKHRPDLVTMDVALPQMSGIEAARKILKLHKEAKIIIISAMGQEHLVMEAIHIGAKDYILKPFDSNDVLKTIGQLFRNHDQSIHV